MDDKFNNPYSEELPFTGERFVPEVKGNIELEHLHRYLVATMLAEGKTVLDIASGEGYGSAMLAKKAKSVIGVDISPEAVKHAQQRYTLENLKFITGSCAEIPLPDASIDLVVSFETIEHHDQHEKMMEEIRRVLRTDGVLMISSPDKYNYSVIPGYNNPFHIKELYRHEFEDLLAKYFQYFSISGQRVIYGSVIFDEKTDNSNISYRKEDNRIKKAIGIVNPFYLIAVASNIKIPSLAASVFEQPIHESDITKSWSNLVSERDRRITDFERLVAEREQALQNLSQRLNEHNEQIVNLKQVITERDEQITNLEQSLKNRDERITDLENVSTEKEQALQNLSQRLNEHNEQIVNLKQVITERDEQITNLEQSLKNRDERITDLENVSTEKEQALQNLSQRLNEHNEQIVNLKQVITERDEQITNLEQSLKNRDERITDLENVSTEKEQALQNLSQRLNEHNEQIVNLKQVITERDEQITNLEQSLKNRDERITDLENVSTEKEQALQNLSQRLNEHNEQIVNLKQVITERDEQITNLEQSLKNRDERITDLENVSTEKEQALQNLSQRLNEHNEQIVNLKQVITERDEQITNLEQSLKNRDERITDLEGMAAEKDTIINAIKSSHSWRITRPLRSTFDFFRDQQQNASIIFNKFLKIQSCKLGFQTNSGNKRNLKPQICPNSSDTSTIGDQNIKKAVTTPSGTKKILLVSYYCPTRAHAGGLRILDIYSLIKNRYPDVRLELYTHKRPSIDGIYEDLPLIFDSIYESPVEQLTITGLTEIMGCKPDRTYDVIDFQFHQPDKDLNEFRSLTDKIIFTPMESLSRSVFLDIETGGNGLKRKSLESIIRNFNDALEEIRLIRSADETVCVSEADARFLRKLSFNKKINFLETGISMLEFPMLKDSYLESPNITQKQNIIIFLAYFGSETNVIALKWFLNHVHPLITARVPNYSLDVVGRGDLSLFEKYSNNAIHLVGAVPSVNPYIERAKIGIAPALGGAGFRGKINQYSIFRVPSVASPIAAHGLAYRDKHDIFVADTPELFAERCIQLLTDNELNAEIAKRAWETCLNHYTWTSKLDTIAELYNLKDLA